MLLDSQSFTEINPIKGMSDLDYVQTDTVGDAASAMDEWLDASSLNTVLAMLEVIDSAEDLALLETLTLVQKRQVWDATPESIRVRLKQLRGVSSPEVEVAFYSPVNAEEPEAEIHQADGDIEHSALDIETTLADLEVLPDQLALLSDPMSAGDARQPIPGIIAATPATPVLRLVKGDWVVLQAKPQITAAEMVAIWEVIEVQGNDAQIFTEKLGTHTYPIAWMKLYPKPIGYVEPEF